MRCQSVSRLRSRPAVIAAANRANVTVYAIDAGGLRIHGTTEEARAEVVAMAQRRIHQ